jgi:hypothetical protein
VNEEERAILARFRKRVAFHVRISGVLSKVCSEEAKANPLYAEARRFVPAVGLMRLRELVARYPAFEAETDFG